MLVYKYNEKGIFVGAEETELDPLESELQGKEIYLLPPNATFTAPEEKEGFASVWDGEKWTMVEDHRGTKYWLPEDKYGEPAREMKDVGVLPDGASLTEPEPTAEELAEQELAQAKAERADAVSKIIVEVDGMAFDGGEHAQARMANAIKASEILGRSSVIWVLANDEVATVTVEQLKEAFAKSVGTMCEFWPKPYERA